MKAAVPPEETWLESLEASSYIGLDAFDGVSKRRARMLFWSSHIMVSLEAPFAFAYIAAGHYTVGLVITVMLAAAILNWQAVRQHKNPSRGGVFAAVAALGILVVDNSVTGGFFDPNFGVFYLLPVMATVFSNFRVGIAFTIAVAFVIVGFWTLPYVGLPVPSVVPPDDHALTSLLNCWAALIAISVLMGFVGQERRVLAGLLDRTRRALKAEESDLSSAESELQKSEQVATMGSLVASVAHEINNPLAYAMGNLEIAASALERGEEPYDLPVMRGEATAGLTRVRSLVGELKMFSRIEARDSATIDIHIALSMAINLVVNAVRHRAYLVTDYTAPPSVVSVNEGRLVQLFVNLLTNAVHSIAPGHADANEIRIQTRSHDDGVAIVIFDTGRGIHPSIADRVFEPFFTTRSIGDGSGLGLSICRNIVEHLHGTLELAPRTDRNGTEAIIWLPCSPGEGAANYAAGEQRMAPSDWIDTSADLSEAASRVREAAGSEIIQDAVGETQASDAPEPEAADPWRSRVLVIDDEPEILRMTARWLKRYIVTTTADPREAIKLATDNEFDIVICDLNMPTMTGMALYRTVIERRPRLTDRFVFVTGGSFTSEAQAFTDAMGDAILDKPIDFKALRVRIERMGPVSGD